MKNPSAKGSSFERKICKTLSLLVSNGKRSDLFARGAMSGGRATVMNRKVANSNITQLGDIYATCSDGDKLISKVIIECKHRKDIHLDSLIYNDKIKESVLDWWVKLCKLCDVANKLPMLICRNNNKKILLLTKSLSLYKLHLINLPPSTNSLLCVLDIGTEKVYVWDFEEFVFFDKCIGEN